jgi:hypothetical protein
VSLISNRGAITPFYGRRQPVRAPPPARAFRRTLQGRTRSFQRIPTNHCRDIEPPAARDTNMSSETSMRGVERVADFLGVKYVPNELAGERTPGLSSRSITESGPAASMRGTCFRWCLGPVCCHCVCDGKVRRTLRPGLPSLLGSLKHPCKRSGPASVHIARPPTVNHKPRASCAESSGTTRHRATFAQRSALPVPPPCDAGRTRGHPWPIVRRSTVPPWHFHRSCLAFPGLSPRLAHHPGVGSPCEP